MTLEELIKRLKEIQAICGKDKIVEFCSDALDPEYVFPIGIYGVRMVEFKEDTAYPSVTVEFV